MTVNPDLRDSLGALLDRPWLLPEPAVRIEPVSFEGAVVRVVRDDLLHPLYGGNKLRKLDAYLPALEADGVTDVVTCGGLQSSHATALAGACAQLGLGSHVVLRGERPQVPTGYALLTGMLATSTRFVTRAAYADRDQVLLARADELTAEAARHREHRRVAIVPEGAADVRALYGCIRLLAGIADAVGSVPARLVIDAGTGTTALGLAIGVDLLDLPWTVEAVELVPDDHEATRARVDALSEAFSRAHPPFVLDRERLTWHARRPRRRFGSVVAGEVARCAQVARATGLVLDPLYTLAAWDHALRRAAESPAVRVVMVHTGGQLNLMGLAQRHPGPGAGEDDPWFNS